MPNWNFFWFPLSFILSRAICVSLWVVSLSWSLQLSRNHFKLLSLELSLQHMMMYWSCGIPTQMQWYHFIFMHPPSHPRRSQKSVTISLQTPHSPFPDAPIDFQDFRKVVFSLHYTFEPIMSLKLIQIKQESELMFQSFQCQFQSFQCQSNCNWVW